MWIGASAWPSCSPPWPEPRTSSCAGSRSWIPPPTTPPSTIRWWRPASRSRSASSPSPCRAWACRPGPSWAGRRACARTRRTARPGSSSSTPPRSGRAWSAGRWPSWRASRAWARMAASPRWAAAAPTPRPWHWRQRSRPTAATSSPMSTASTPPTRGSCPVRASSPASPTRRCWRWPRWGPRCWRRARWRWPCGTACGCRCSRVSRTSPARSSSMRMRSWKARSSAASPTATPRRGSRSMG